MCHAVTKVSGNAAASHERDGIGDRHQVLDRHLDQLGIASGVVAIAEHLVVRALVVAARQAREAPPAADARLKHHPRARRKIPALRVDDDPGDVAARDVRQRNRDTPQAAPLPQIQVIERAGTNPHQRFARSDDRIGNLLEPQDFRAAVVVEADSLHGIWVIEELSNSGNRVGLRKSDVQPFASPRQSSNYPITRLLNYPI